MSPQPHILVAEDQRASRLFLATTLRCADMRVSEVANGRDVASAIEQDRPDLLLLDVGLPGLVGYAVCRQLRAEPATATIKIVLVTARTQPQERVAGFDAGADDYLVKPFTPGQLVTAVEGWLAPTTAATADAVPQIADEAPRPASGGTP